MIVKPFGGRLKEIISSKAIPKHKPQFEDGLSGVVDPTKKSVLKSLEFVPVMLTIPSFIYHQSGILKVFL